MDAVKDPIDFDVEIAKLEQAAQSGANVWDDAVNAGMELNKSLDTRRFELGDLAVLIGKKYGQDTIGKFATEIGVGKKRLQEYRTVAHFYEKSLRMQIFNAYPSLTYSHMRTAMKLASPAEVMGFLEECATNDWSVEKAGVEIKDRAGEPLPPEKLIEASVVVTGTDRSSGTMTFKFVGGLFPVEINQGTRLRLTLHAAEVSAVQS
jgi:hypothetical protein